VERVTLENRFAPLEEAFLATERNIMEGARKEGNEGLDELDEKS